ncbi:MAG: GDP-mannose 4,6-dehydratase [Alphaproteobacteria bacterium]
MRKYIILGGNGVFGVHCALWLLENADPAKVICVGRNPEKPEPFTLNLGKGDPRYSYHQIHVGFECDRLMELFDNERPDVIINFAAQGEGAASWRYSWRFFDTNATALARVTEMLMSRRYLQRWIQIGTSELYGSVDKPANEDAPLCPSSPYAVSKAAADLHLMSIANVLNFPMNIIRPSNAYAPGQLLHRVLPRAVVAGLAGRKMPLHGGGQAKKSYIHARDLARAIWLVSERAPFGRVYNVGSKSPVTIRELVDQTAKAIGIPLSDLVEETPPRPGEDSVYWLDSSRIAKELGWTDEIALEEGIGDMVAWGRKYLDQLTEWPTDYVLKA